MKDYIKKAVELADGFEYKGNETTMAGGVRPFVKTPIGLLSVSWGSFIKTPAYLDALAAQLVRQVDAALNDWRLLELFGGHTAVRAVDKELRENNYEGHDLGACYGQGRTMNTIKAIVDSEVLE